MKIIYETIDGQVFLDKEKANIHEKNLMNNSKDRVQLLLNNVDFMNYESNDELLLNVRFNYDEEGRSRSYELLSGTKNNIINYISMNNKYWFYKNYEISIVKFININEKMEGLEA